MVKKNYIFNINYTFKVQNINMSFSKIQTPENTITTLSVFEVDGIYAKHLGRGAEMVMFEEDNLERITQMFEQGKAVTTGILIRLPNGMKRHVTLAFRHDDEFKGRKTMTTHISRACAIKMLLDLQQEVSELKVHLCGFVDFGPFLAAIVHLGRFQHRAQILREMMDREAPEGQTLHNLHVSTCGKVNPETGELTTRGDDVWGDEHEYWSKHYQEAKAADLVFKDGVDLPFLTAQHLNLEHM